METDLIRDGAALIPYDRALHAWGAHAAPVARALAVDPELRAQWLRYQGTWFVGVNVLPNGADGRLPGGPALALPQAYMHATQWDRAQISVTYPGYPKPDPAETPAAHRFRRDRDAAHLDGLLPVGPTRRRLFQERHRFVVGLPLNKASTDASPMVYWRGSHELMRAALIEALSPYPPESWPDIDLTEAYGAARKRCFETCERVALHEDPGAGYVLHRFTLHGVAPWAAGAMAPPEGRMIAYFRPDWQGGLYDWLHAA